MATITEVWAAHMLQDMQKSQVKCDFGPIPRRTWSQWWEQKTYRFQLAYRVLRTGDCGCERW